MLFSLAMEGTIVWGTQLSLVLILYFAVQLVSYSIWSLSRYVNKALLAKKKTQLEKWLNTLSGNTLPLTSKIVGR